MKIFNVRNPVRNKEISFPKPFNSREIAIDKSQNYELKESGFKNRIAKSINTLEEFKGKKVCFISPHPDDSEIGCGATMYRLNEVGATVHNIVCTTGANGVRDKDIKLVKRRYYECLDMDYFPISNFTDEYFKTLVRKYEVINALHSLGIPGTNAHFLKLGFYNNPIPDVESDIQKMVNCFKMLKPDVLIVEGGFSDPNGTHELCYLIVKEAFERIKSARTNPQGPSLRVVLAST